MTLNEILHHILDAALHGIRNESVETEIRKGINALPEPVKDVAESAFDSVVTPAESAPVQ